MIPNKFESTEPLNTLNNPNAIQKNILINTAVERKKFDDFKKFDILFI